ncbi:MAG: RidA family protein [Phycisphaerales bacterium]|nr:RidA family protein [Phycisphaerales bacterium]
MPNHCPNKKLQGLQITLPTAPKPVASYLPARRSGNQVFISGQIPFEQGELIATGLVPSMVNMETAVRCARACTLNALACLKAEIGDLGLVTGVVRVGVFVACDPDFGGHPQIANGCSDLLVEIFGDIGKHARAAVGCASLPLNAPVEIEFLFEIADSLSEGFGVIGEESLDA